MSVCLIPHETNTLDYDGLNRERERARVLGALVEQDTHTHSLRAAAGGQNGSIGASAQKGESRRAHHGWAFERESAPIG